MIKSKIKSIIFSASVMALTVPALASAQFVTPPATNLPRGTIYDIVTKVMYWVLGMVGIIGVIGFAIAGILYLTAAGDEDRIATAKRAMTYSIIGVIVALVGIVILQAAQSMLSGQNSRF